MFMCFMHAFIRSLQRSKRRGCGENSVFYYDLISAMRASLLAPLLPG